MSKVTVCEALPASYFTAGHRLRNSLSLMSRKHSFTHRKHAFLGGFWPNKKVGADNS
jgi:hypothetical protein